MVPRRVEEASLAPVQYFPLLDHNEFSKLVDLLLHGEDAFDFGLDLVVDLCQASDFLDLLQKLFLVDSGGRMAFGCVNNRISSNVVDFNRGSLSEAGEKGRLRNGLSIQGHNCQRQVLVPGHPSDVLLASEVPARSDGVSVQRGECPLAGAVVILREQESVDSDFSLVASFWGFLDVKIEDLSCCVWSVDFAFLEPLESIATATEKAELVGAPIPDGKKNNISTGLDE
ncbi:hypothetical protein MKX08_004355 [Trichoderma sp. CBMAI-0020]|nr:hypothetical protein MKX08_004355 [Trichoderma sp. CBMAI-0020]